MKSLLIFIVLCLSLTVFSQDYDFGKVSKEELQEKFNPLDSSASATYLYKYRRTYFEYKQGLGFTLFTEIHERIKIYNQEGFKYATQVINLYQDNSDKEKVTGLKAYTYNLNGEKIEDEKLKNEGIFETELNEFFNQTKFTMPSVKEGSVIEFKYLIYSPFFSKVDEFVFQEEIPIKKITAKFEAPEYFIFKSNFKGFLFVTPKVETKRGKISFTSKNRQSRTGYTGVSTTYSSSFLDFNIKVQSYDLTNIPALLEEPYVNNMFNYRSSVNYELSYTKFPDSQIEYYSTTWEDVVKKIYENPNFGSELDKSGYYNDDIDALIASESNPLSKVILIYDFVKNNIKWNGYYSKYSNNGLRHAYKEHSGNVAEINLMLTSMFRYAGLDANPVLVSTRENGIPLFPTRDGYNYVVSSVNIENEVILLDATSKNAYLNVLPFRTLNWDGRIIRKDGTSLSVSLYPKENSKNIMTMMVNLDENGDIDGNFRSMKSNHNALSFREIFNGKDENDYLEKLENKYNGIEVSEFEVLNALEISKPVTESYKFHKESQADIIGDKMYFSPFFHLKISSNPFKLEKREFPVDFGYPFSESYRLGIDLPEGYKVETVPDSKIISLPNNLGIFRYNVSFNDSQVQLLVQIDVNESIIVPSYYESLKEFFKQLIEKENEQVVLTKIL